MISASIRFESDLQSAMSLFSSNFTFKRTKSRKAVSKTPLKLTAEEIARDLGPRCNEIDVRIADRKIHYDLRHGGWNTGLSLAVNSNPTRCFVFPLDEAETIGGSASAADARRVQNQITVLSEENNMLKLKVEVLMNLVAEYLADLPSARS